MCKGESQLVVLMEVSCDQWEGWSVALRETEEEGLPLGFQLGGIGAAAARLTRN